MQIIRTKRFDSWLSHLRDGQAARRISYRLQRCGIAGKVVGDAHPAGGGVSEMRFHFGPGYRVYFAQKESRLILLLAGGEKHSQNQDIKTARLLLKQMEVEGRW